MLALRVGVGLGRERMKPISISAKTEMLREEIKRILLEERLYRQATQRSRGSGRDARELRLMEIREELAELRTPPSRT